jgi:methylthioxylose transferase
MSHRTFWAALLVGAALSLVVCYIIATQSMILGSREAGWWYGYRSPFTVRALGAAILISGFSSILLLAARPAPGIREWVLVLAWVLVATSLHGLLRSLTPITLDRILVSDAASSFYSVTNRYDVGDVLSDFNEVRARSPLHAQSNMPGKLVFLYALRAVSARPDVLAWLIVLVSNLGGALMYVFVRDLFRDRRIALYSLVLYLFVPAKLFFFPLMNTVTPVVVLACTTLVLRWLQTGRTTYAALLGPAIYGLAFFEPLPLVMGVLFAALIVRAVWIGEIPARRIPTQIAAGAIGFASTYVVMYASFGFDMLEAFRQIGSHAVEFNAISGRAYGVWVRENLREFVVGVGVCQAVVFWAALADGLHGPGPWLQRLIRPITVLCSCLLAILLATDLIGVNRGEVIRLWIFLACFFQIPCAYVCARLPGHAAIVLVLATTALQAALGTAMIAFIIPG